MTKPYVKCELRLACSLVVGGAGTNVVLVLLAVLAGVYGAALRAVVRAADGTQELVDGGELALVLEEREAAAVGRQAVERGCARRRLRALHTQRLVALVELVAANLTEKSSAKCSAGHGLRTMHWHTLWISRSSSRASQA